MIIPCLVSESAEIFPFGLLSKTELCDLLEVEFPMQAFEKSLQAFYLSAYLVQTYFSQLFFVLLLLLLLFYCYSIIIFFV